MDNYTEVLNELTVFGLQINQLIVDGKCKRCRFDNSKDKKGWYVLHEITLDNGQHIIVGSYGFWEGNDNNAQKIQLKAFDIDKEQSAAIKKRIAEDKKTADAQQKAQAYKVAKRAEELWKRYQPDGDSDYLRKKQVPALGLRFSKDGALIVPVTDTSGNIHGLQVIFNRKTQQAHIEKNGGKDKKFGPYGMSVTGHFHLIGMPSSIVVIAEGYATAASIHLATGLPVAVAFNAGNLVPVAQALKARYKRTNILIAADDDAYQACRNCKEPVNVNEGADCKACGQPHGKENAGTKYASLAALAVGGRVITPVFTDELARFEHYRKSKGKITDFNDLHVSEGLHLVSQQFEQSLNKWGWAEVAQAREVSTQGSGDARLVESISRPEELLTRFSLVMGKGGVVFDSKEHMLMLTKDMLDMCRTKEPGRIWKESPQRRIVRPENVGFDPAGKDPDILCNLWGGWPTEPKQGECDKLLGLLKHMCNGESNPAELWAWVIKWLAYPIQNPGAKMRTTIVIHGPQGTGKNLFFECIMDIYGQYGRIIDQSAIEDKFNDWASKKLFLIADEVIARSDLYHVKNKLKAFITGEWIRVNPKNMAAYEERNHVNLVFLSNERMPVVIEEDDRRHCIIWTPDKKGPDYYKSVYQEIRNGGIAALHHYLLNIDLGDFDEHAKPPMTVAKAELVNLSKDTSSRFIADLQSGEIEGFVSSPTLSIDLFELYKRWCHLQNVKPMPFNRFVDNVKKKHAYKEERKRYLMGTFPTKNPKTFLYPPDCDGAPAGVTETAWLGERVDEFKQAYIEYNKRSYD